MINTENAYVRDLQLIVEVRTGLALLITFLSSSTDILFEHAPAA